MWWIMNEIFDKYKQKNKTEMEIQQDAFEEEYARDMMEAVEAQQS